MNGLYLLTHLTDLLFKFQHSFASMFHQSLMQFLSMEAETKLGLQCRKFSLRYHKENPKIF